jgi:hypothetical protein
MISSRRRRNELAKVSKPSPVRSGRAFSLKSGRPPLGAENPTSWVVSRLRRSPLLRSFRAR